MNKHNVDPKKHQKMIDNYNYRKAHPGVFTRMKKFFTPYDEMVEYRNREPSPIKKVAPYLPMLLIITVIYGATQLVHNLKVNSKEKSIAAYVQGTQNTADDGIFTDKKELGQLAHAMLKMKLTKEEIGTLIDIRNKLNGTDNFIWDPISIGRLIETLQYQTEYISTDYRGNGDYMKALLLKWVSEPGLAPDAVLRRSRVYDVVGAFNANASDELKAKVKAHSLTDSN